jgi:hypothetical protein
VKWPPQSVHAIASAGFPLRQRGQIRTRSCLAGGGEAGA